MDRRNYILAVITTALVIISGLIMEIEQARWNMYTFWIIPYALLSFWFWLTVKRFLAEKGIGSTIIIYSIIAIILMDAVIGTAYACENFPKGKLSGDYLLISCGLNVLYLALAAVLGRRILAGSLKGSLLRPFAVSLLVCMLGAIPFALFLMPGYLGNHFIKVFLQTVPLLIIGITFIRETKRIKTNRI